MQGILAYINALRSLRSIIWHFIAHPEHIHQLLGHLWIFLDLLSPKKKILKIRI